MLILLRQPTVSAFVRNASRGLSDSWAGVCLMAGRGVGGFGSIHQFVLEGVMGDFRVVLHLRLVGSGSGAWDRRSLPALVSTPCHLKPCMRFSLTRLSDNLLPGACGVPCRTFSTTTSHRFRPEQAADNPLATGHSLRGSCRDLWNWWNWPFRACTVTYLPALARLKQGSFPPIELCCLRCKR